MLFAMAGMAKQCSKHNSNHMIDQNYHAPLVHKMELTLADDLNSDDSATAGWASKFINEIEAEFRSYAPDSRTVKKLISYAPGMEVKVIGGNWCSDTRLQVPRLCRVLNDIGLQTEGFSYFRVDRNKKPVENDFAATRTIGAVPDIIVFYKGKEVGRIIETPQKSLEADLLNLLNHAD